jgi:hypothetical protein
MARHGSPGRAQLLGILTKERGASVVDPNHYINQAMIHAAKK